MRIEVEEKRRENPALWYAGVKCAVFRVRAVVCGEALSTFEVIGDEFD